MTQSVYNHNNKFDIQLSKATVDERRLGDIFTTRKIERIELKTENYQWEKTGNICIEIKQRGEPSGISVTEADYWVHELQREGETLVYLMFPVDRLKELCKTAGTVRKAGGDGGRFTNVTIPIRDILK